MTDFARFARAALMIAAASGAFAVAGPVQAQVQAQEAPEADSGEGSEIVVTARRRAERLIDVPVAVTAISGEALEARGALDLTDVQSVAPNVTLETSRGTNSTLSAFIRGIGQQDPVSGFEQGVGIYLDDVYLNRPQGAVLDIYDVERIEVLRGPQGTLYGRNTIGGAVKYVTRALPDELEVKLRGTVGTYKQADLVASIAVPLGDIARVGVSGARLSRGGFGDNLTTGLDNYNKDVWAGRGTLELGGRGAPVLIRISGDYTRDKSNPRGGHRLIASQFTAAPVLDDVFDTRGALNSPVQDVEAYGIAMNVSAELSDWLTLRSISAWRKDDSASPIDFDALPSVDVDVPALYANSQISQEFQLLVDSGPINALLGFYYLSAQADTAFDVRLFTTLNGLTAFTNAQVDTETYAVFGDLTFDVSDQISLSVGGRYTWDERKAKILRQNFLGGGSPVFGGAGVAFGAPSTNFTGTRDFNKFTPRASISFKPTPDHNIYASFSQGFKGGGFDPRGVGVNARDINGNGIREDSEIAEFLGFAPESVDSYEIGYKAALFDRRLSLALAAFRMDYTDVQIPGSSGCVVNGIATFCGVITNAGKARFQGLELEATASLSDALTLSGAVGYIDAEYKRYITQIAGRGPVDVAAFREVQNTPKLTATGTIAYTAELGSGALNLSTTASYRSKTFQFEIPNPFIDQKGYALLDASIVYTADGGGWSLGLHGKNLTDKEYKTSGYSFVAADPVTGALTRNAAGNLIPSLGREGTLTAFYGNPRQIFLTGTVKF
jgi:iron complex outermembrane recepter protein